MVSYSWLYVLKCESLHFLLGFLVASLTFWSISTMYLWYSTALKHRSISTSLTLRRAVFYILCFSLLASVVSHVLEDYLFSYF